VDDDDDTDELIKELQGIGLSGITSNHTMQVAFIHRLHLMVSRTSRQPHDDDYDDDDDLLLKELSQLNIKPIHAPSSSNNALIRTLSDESLDLALDSISRRHAPATSHITEQSAPPVTATALNEKSPALASLSSITHEPKDEEYPEFTNHAPVLRDIDSNTVTLQGGADLHGETTDDIGHLQASIEPDILEAESVCDEPIFHDDGGATDGDRDSPDFVTVHGDAPQTICFPIDHTNNDLSTDDAVLSFQPRASPLNLALPREEDSNCCPDVCGECSQCYSSSRFTFEVNELQGLMMMMMMMMRSLYPLFSSSSLQMSLGQSHTLISIPPPHHPERMMMTPR
jgi:hypothetical protein